MKKTILLFLIPFTMTMADFTLAGQKLIPINEDEPTSNTSTAPTTNPRGTAKTNWGFQPFAIPSHSVTVPAGGDIQAAIDSLPNGGTIYLKEGTYIASDLTFIGKKNIVLQGAGRGKTILKPKPGNNSYIIFSHCNHLASWDKRSPCTENIILRDFEIDGKGTVESGITFAWGVSNLLMKNIEIHNVTKSAFVINNQNMAFGGKYVTLEDSYVHDVGLHGFAVRFTKGIVVNNYKAENLKQGIDLSSCKYAEISNVIVERALWGGMKFPSISHLYMHDTTIKDSYVSGIKLQEGTKYPPTEPQNIHFQNVIVENSGAGILWIGLKTKFNPPITSFIIDGVKLINNRDNWDTATNKPVKPYGPVHTQIRANVKVQDLYEFGDSIGITYTRPVKHHKYPNTTPEEIGVGWSSWRAIK